MPRTLTERESKLSYRSWVAMKSRCNNPNRHNYKNYGGRGIKVCQKWKNFDDFYKDMGDRPSREYTLGRIDPDGNYCKSNCRWSTRGSQQHNKARVRANSGYRGVCKSNKKWQAVITYCGTQHYIGVYDTPEEAYAEYLNVERQLYQ